MPRGRTDTRSQSQTHRKRGNKLLTSAAFGGQSPPPKASQKTSTALKKKKAQQAAKKNAAYGVGRPLEIPVLDTDMQFKSKKKGRRR